MVKNLSVLIPVYNFNIFPLLEQLNKIAPKLKIPYEILVVDDASSSFFREKNKSISTFKNVNYQELELNIGRSKIRNLLFEKAKYDSCIILDCDVLLAKEDFLEQYILSLTDENVVVGGHIYLAKAPRDKSLYFHWLYGRKIESQPVTLRKEKPYSSFKTNSFAISKKCFQSIKFNESISEYGHEDTLFGIELEKLKIPIVHINNPVVHLGLDNENEFLEKQEKAIVSLVKLYKSSNYKKNLEENIKLVRFYQLFYNKQAYRFFIAMISLVVRICKTILPFNFLKLSWFNLWKLEKFDYYYKNL